MSAPTIKIHDLETGDVIEREMTEKELANLEQVQNGVAEEKRLEADKAATKAALLEKLGLTEDEAKILLG